jgi:MFS family permease
VATAVGAGIALGARAVFGNTDQVAALSVVLVSAGYLVAAVIGSRLRPDSLGPDLEGRRPPLDLRGELRSLESGVRYLYSRRAAWNALAALGVFRVTFGLMTVAIILLQKVAFHDPHDVDGGLAGVAATFVALGIGVPIGAALTPPAVRRWGAGRWVPAVMVGTGVGLAVLGLPFEPVPIMAAAFLLGLGAQAVKVSVDATVQRAVDDAHRGLVFALYDVVFNVAFVAAVAVAGWALPADGRSAPVLVAGAAAIVLGGLWYARVTPRAPLRSPAGEPTTAEAPPPPPPDPADHGPAGAPAGGGTPAPRPDPATPPARP